MPCFIHFLVGGKPVNSCTRLSHNLATYSQCVCGKERERERAGKRVKGWGVVKVVMNAAVARNIALSSGRWFASTLANLTQSISHLHVVVARLPQKFLHCCSSWSHSDHMRMCVGLCVCLRCGMWMPRGGVRLRLNWIAAAAKLFLAQLYEVFN